MPALDRYEKLHITHFEIVDCEYYLSYALLRLREEVVK